MGDAWISLVVGVLKGASFLYDVVTFLPWLIFDNPAAKVSRSKQIKAKPVSEDPSGPYRTIGNFNGLTTTLFRECETVDDLFTRAVSLYGANECLGTREVLSEEDELQKNGKVFKKLVLGNYSWLTYDEVAQRITNLGNGLLALGQKPRSNICLFAETRAEWMLVTQACLRFNFPVVTLYSTLGEDAIVHGIDETEVTHIITSAELLPKFKNILNRMPRVQHIIYIDQPAKRPKLDGFPSNVHIHSLSSVEQMGATPDHKNSTIQKPTRDDLALIMYTSGSTGLPKGVMITHGNLMCGMSGQCQRVPNLGPDDTYIGYLPLAHVLELSAELSCLSHGVRIGYSSPLTLSDQSSKIKRGCKGDASVLRPTLMAAVPVIMDRLYKAVWEKVNDQGKMMRALFQWAYDYKKRKIISGYDTPLFNRSIFKSVRALLGGRVRMMLSGGAPLSEDTQLFMNICFCCPVGQGYGLTETCGAGTVQEATDLSTGRVGSPLQCNELMLRDWVEGGYTTLDKPCPRGEVLIGGGNIVMGYYKNPAKTREDFFEKNGQRWFCTGDIGQMEEDGCLRIIDRKKDLVKLQAGEYVSLGKVETALKMCPLVENICVYADSHQMFAVALVVPNKKQMMAVAKQLGMDTNKDWAILCDEKELEAHMLKALQQHAQKAKLERFEVPARIKLCHDVWTPDTGLVTDAFKLKRKELQSRYTAEINRMYA